MATSKRVIQGKAAASAVNQANRVIIDAQAHGIRAEQGPLLLLVTATAPLRV